MKLNRALSVSLALNAIALSIGAYVVHSRGGLSYLRSRLGLTVEAATFAGYSNREHLFRCLDSDRPIVFLGDSIIQNAEWHELIQCDVPVINRGIGGDTSLGVLRRIGTIARLKPRAVFLQVGTNDAYLLGLEPRETVANLRAIVRGLHPARVFVLTLLPSGSPKKNRFVCAANDEIRRGIAGAEVIDLHDAFLLGDKLNPRYSADGLHLNGEGYLMWREFVAQHVRETVSSSRRNTAGSTGAGRAGKKERYRHIQ